MSEEKPPQMIPGWVYLLMFGFLIAVLLGVESLLNWLLPGR